MKRFTMIVALLLMVAMPMMAERVTPETAQKVAQTFLNNNGAKSAQLTDLSKIAGFPNLYIFTAKQGFVVMAADDCVQPILGYSLTGHFVAENMPENLRWWLQGYSDEIQSAIDNKMKASTETSKQWKDLTEGNSKAGKATIAVAPLIQTKWNQNKYYNSLCPPVSDGIEGRAFTGCVATSMAQIMKYWNYPSTGIGSHSYTWNGQTLSANFGETTYDWDNMADYYEYYFANGTDPYPTWLPDPSEEEIAAVATLMYHCGVSVNMIYGGNSTGGSAATIYAVANALQTYFNYKNTVNHKQKSFNSNIYYSDEEWIALLKADLDAQRPVQYGGQDPQVNSGHAFVCDGYDSDDFFHFNWGWAGGYNGYFSINNLDTGANNGEAGAGNGVYTRDQEAVFGIEPASMLPTPTNLTYTINGSNVIVLTWDAVSAAASYNVYRDGNLIGNTTENTYSETASFGTHSYYVRAMDANSQLSLASNTITLTLDYPTPIVNDLAASLSGNNANLSWTAPEWCYPETPSATLTYGDGIFSGHIVGFNDGSKMYWGHRYSAESLAEYNNMVLYKSEFYALETGAYKIFVYKGTTSSSLPQTKVLEQQLNVDTEGWFEFDLSTQIAIDASKDYWVFMYDPEGRAHPATFTQYSGNEGNYYSTAPTSWVLTYNGAAFLIKTYVTDGTYTYNLYDGTTTVASNIANTTYTINNIANNTAHQYTLKTNYYGGETEASNMAGLTLGTASLNSLQMAANDQMTITEGSKLTVSGTLSNDNAANLIIEDGAQLVHNTAGVKATVKKTIEPYITDEDGWNFIASPVTESITPSADNGLLTNAYDLYMFDQSEEKEWRNIKANSFSNIEHKTGYLYANNTNTTLAFAGTLAPSTDATPLAYDANATLKGFNLIGNPYPCNATITNDFYIISGIEVALAANGTTIAPCEGVFVKATDAGQTVTFNKATSTKGSNSTDCFDLVIAQGRANIDRARVRFGEGIGMEKYTLNQDNTQISLWQNGQDFAVAYVNGQDEMPLNFKANHDGVYTLNIEADQLELGYLHLIDNLTGTETDLLATPSYTFEATTSDYTSRFRLLFAPAEELSTNSGNFAFFANGHLHIFNQGKAHLQLIDMTGHVLLAEALQGSLDKALDLTPGVYVVRLVSEKNTRSMKIVVD